MICYSSSKQRQLIGYFRKLLGIDSDTYYEIISNFGVESSKELTYSDAEQLLQDLKKQAVNMGKFELQKSNYEKYNTLSGRFGMGTPKQLRKINVMWKQVSRQPTEELKEKALNVFLKRITGKERMNFLTQSDVSKVIKAIEKMQKGCSNAKRIII